MIPTAGLSFALFYLTALNFKSEVWDLKLLGTDLNPGFKIEF
jgi:hypothetical protein